MEQCHDFIHLNNINDINFSQSAQVPDPPMRLDATVVSPTSIRLSWQGPRNDSSTFAITSYKIYYYDLGDTTAENEVNVVGTTYTFNDLKRYTQYSFRIVSVNDAGTSPSTDEVVRRTLSDGAYTIIVISNSAMLAFAFRKSFIYVI